MNDLCSNWLKPMNKLRNIFKLLSLSRPIFADHYSSPCHRLIRYKSFPVKQVVLPAIKYSSNKGVVVS